MDGDFQHIYFLTARTVISEIFDILSLILPSIMQILGTFKFMFKSNGLHSSCAACRTLNTDEHLVL